MVRELNPDVRNIFTNIGVSFWQTAILLLLVILFSGIIIYFWKKNKNFNKVIILSFALSLILGLYILMISYFYPDLSYSIDVNGEIIQWHLEDEMSNLLFFVVNIYLGLVFFIIPFFIFLTIVSLIIGFRRNSALSFVVKTFIGLIIPIAVAMLIAIGLIPLLDNIELVQNTVSEEEGFNSLIVILSGYFLQAGDFMVSSIPLIVIVVVSIIIGVTLRSIVNSKNANDKETSIELSSKEERKDTGIESFFEVGKNTTLNYFRIINYMIPFVILTRLASIFLVPEQVMDLIVFVGVFLIGLIVFVIFWLVISYILSPNKKSYVKNYFTYLIIAFSKGSPINYLPDTIKISEASGVSNDVAEFSSTLGLNIGPAICSGYYLMFIGLIGLNTISEITVINVIALFVLILVINFTTTGIKGGDEVARNILVTTLSTFGVIPTFYYGTIFAIEALLEPIRQLGNSTAYYSSNIITERLISKKTK